MIRLGKHEGLGNVVLEEVPVPDLGPREILVRNHVTLISRGSEILARYMKAEAVDPAIMGYSAAGMVEAVGEQVSEFTIGDRVAAAAPHAEYVAVDLDRAQGPWAVKLPAEASFESATFWPLATSSVVWCWTANPLPEETVVVVGQGLVGSGIMQVLKREHNHPRVLVTEALPLRRKLAEGLGADVVINAAEEDPVARVRELTDGRGADVVIETVGGPPGLKTFPQSLAMTAQGGRLVVVSLYHGGPLPLDAAMLMSRSVLGGNLNMRSRWEASEVALQILADGRLPFESMVTHRFHFRQAKEAFDLLCDRLGEAMAVLLMWDW
ncbi:MAG: zinc-binding dehydrogenase [Armatimonadetes bacterium]|nr:zinc-binding dehydrogenase [Armatimonadota bacterium]